MSVDLYVAVPATQWPTPAAVEQCLAEKGYPVKLKRFPALDGHKIVTDGALVTVDGEAETYLEGELYPGRLARDDVKMINDRLAASPDHFQITDDHAVMSVRVRSPAEMRAASYVVSSLIVCFGGYGFEPQGNAHGRDDFAKSLLSNVAALKGI